MPSSRKAPSPKLQNSFAAFWDLDFGTFLELGIWFLMFIFSPLNHIHAAVPKKMGRLRQAVPHRFRAAVRPGVHGGGSAGQSRLARLADVRTDSGGDGLRADLRDVV